MVVSKLNLYRKHLRGTGKYAGGHPPDSRNYEPEELRRSWKKCFCPIYADGTLGGSFKRKNTKQTSWPEAKAVVEAWEATGAWDVSVEGGQVAAPAPGATSEVAASSPSITIQFATYAYLANRSGRNLAPSTMSKYTSFVKQLRSFADNKGCREGWPLLRGHPSQLGLSPCRRLS